MALHKQTCSLSSTSVPFWDYKPAMNVRCIFPDLRRRMYNSNMLSKLTELMEIGLSETSHLIEQEDTKAEVRLRGCLEELATNCHNYLQITKTTLTGPGTGKTKLDKERVKLCQREIEMIGNMARNLRALVTRSSLKERFKTAQTYLHKLRFLIDDVSWMSDANVEPPLSILFVTAATCTARCVYMAYCKRQADRLPPYECQRPNLLNNRRGDGRSLWKNANGVF